MISAILVGRNDDYDGGFRHRAALSINMLAEQLGEADEIIFVDWNTEDGSATLPEAVAGSLTPRGRRLMRTLRVGGDVHGEYVRRGALMPVIPVVAYNVGIRRANPSSRWILITTPDLLLVSREAGRPLTDIAAGLPDGVYGLPRFELPRWIWQVLDPRDPSAAAACLSSCSKRLHLEEAVRLPPPILFDAPGDFQLVLRADLFAIDGLDEGMFLGALGPDSNLLKRLQLKGRKTASLERSFAGYHCDHTSFPGSSHRVGRMENDMGLFFEEVTKAALPFQRLSWGLADRALPQVRFSEREAPTATPRNTRSVASKRTWLLAKRLADVAAAVGPGQSAPYDTTPQFNRVSYPTRHVVPFLLDRIFDETGSIHYVGVNDVLTRLLAAVLKRLEPQRQLTCLRPEDRTGFQQRYETIHNEDAPPLVIFDFGVDAGATVNNPSIQECDASIRQSLWDVRESFAWCIERERALWPPRDCAPRIVAINAINTEFEAFVLSSLDCSLSPFATRMRSGRVCPESPVPVVSHPAAAHMAGRLGRSRGVHVDEFARSWGIAERIAREPAGLSLYSGWRAPSVESLLDWPGLSAAIAVPDRRIAELRSQIAASREGAAIVTRRRPGSSVPASKLASAADWEDPGWYDVARWYLGGDRSYNVFQRHRRDWEHIHFLFCLDRFGLLDTDAEIVVLARSPDRFAAMLARRVRKVHLVNIGWKPNRRFFRVPELRLDSRIRVYRGLSDPAFREVTAAAVIAQRHRTGFFVDSILRRACRALTADALLGVSFDVCVRAAKGPSLARLFHPLPEVEDTEKGEVCCLASVPPEFKPLSSADWSLDPESFELVAPPADWRWRHMTAERGGRRITSAIRWFRRGAG